MILAERFWPKVAMTSDSYGCWHWTGEKNEGGYGILKVEGATTTAQRVAYVLSIGPIPNGLHIDHLCRTRTCVRPSHLEAVTQQENLLRGVGFAAINAAKTHCIRGHEFTPENTRLVEHSPGRYRRNCRACNRRNLRKVRLLEREAS